MVLAFAVCDALLFLAYTAIATIVWRYVKPRHIAEMQTWFSLFVAFVYACGATHLVAAVTLWWPVYNLYLAVNVVAAGVSVAAMVLLVPLIPIVLRYKPSKAIAELRRKVFELEEQLSEAKKHEAGVTLDELRTILDDIRKES